jgi:hypothetical protein
MVHLAVVPAGAIRLLEMQDRDVVLFGEAADLAAEPGADLLDDDRRGDGLTEMMLAEPLHLVADLEVGDVRVQVIHTVCAPEGRLCRPDRLSSQPVAPGWPGGGPDPLPLMP